ncbi:MAG: hypothetical protein M3345_06775 [Actinomycetota bacterium]|nr:hypothetical protein [Actinomycetota bacterium]
MRARSRNLAVISVVALIATLAVAPVQVQAQAVPPLDVQVGAFLGGPSCNFDTGQGCIPGEGMRYYAPPLKVQAGDVVNFNFQGFHTATLMPRNVDPASWASANSGGVGKPYSLFTQDPDDTALDRNGSAATPSLKANNAAILPTRPDCGAVDNPCVYDGNVLNSGVPFAADTWAVQMEGNPGDTTWVICLVHPHMRLKITIVGSAAEATTQQQIDDAKAAMLRQDNESAASMHRKLLNRQSKHTDADGETVWDAWAGWDNHWIALLAFYPQKLVIQKGDTVRWHFTENIYEDHTATFPRSKAINVASNSFVPWCDPDGDGGPGPDNPPDLQGPPFCSDPSQLEFDIKPRFAYPQGNGVFYRKDYENSGVRGAPFERNDPWDLTFKRSSAHRPFKYMCLIHGGFMSAKVAVRPRR